MKNSLGNCAVLAQNISYYMEQYKKTRKDVCDDLHIKYTTFTDWVKGKSYPRINNLEALADYFHVSKADLVERHPEHYSKQMPVIRPTYASLPLLDQSCAPELFQHPEKDATFVRVPADLPSEEEFFALRIQGNSMSPILEEGDIAIVHRQDTALTGDIAIVAYNNRILCRRVIMSDGSLILVSTASGDKPYLFTSAKVQAKVIEVLGICTEVRRALPSSFKRA